MFIKDINVYLPKKAISMKEFRKAWGGGIPKGIEEKRVASFDEDAVTMALDAAGELRSEIAGIEELSIAIHNPPYTEKFVPATIVQGLGLSSEVSIKQYSSAGLGGISALVSAGNNSLVISSVLDRSPGYEPYQWAFGDGAVALLTSPDNGFARLLSMASYTEEFVGDRYDVDEKVKELGIPHYTTPEYIKCVSKASTAAMNKAGCTSEDIKAVMAYGPDTRTMTSAIKKAGIDPAKLITHAGKTGVLTGPGPLVDLAFAGSLLEKNDKVLLCGYTPGASAQAIVLEITGKMPELSFNTTDIESIDYVTYLKLKRAIG